MDDRLSWGILFHLLGVANKSRAEFGEPSADQPRIVELLREYEDYQAELGFEVERKARRTGAEMLLDLVEETEKILHPQDDNSPLASECNADRAKRGKALDGIEGYSRDPFKRFRSEQHRDRIAMAAVCYLLRGYAAFFCRARSCRDFNAAKTALNDFYQASQLGWRLCNHYGEHGHDLEKYIQAVVEKPGAGSRAPGSSPYFIWSVLLLADIFRGNIYRQIEFIREAERHYRRAEGRFDQVCARLQQADRFDEKFATPTSIRALFERSKVRFDLGQFLESLQTQAQCLACLVRYASRSTDRQRLLDTLRRVCDFLGAEYTLPIHDRKTITRHFGDPGARAGALSARRNALDPARVVRHLPPSFAPLAAEILARMGFTLYTFCHRPMKPLSAADAEWLNRYCRFDMLWNQAPGRDKRWKIRAARLGQYCETLYRNQAGSNTPIFEDEIERRFSLLLRRVQPGGRISIPREGRSVDERGFYRGILLSATQNITNLVTVPRRNQHMLMRRGYKHRRTCGDLSWPSLTQGLREHRDRRSSIEIPQDQLLGLNKLVVLRRWQSFNPKIPRAAGADVRGGGYFLMWHGKGIVIDPGYDFIQNFYDEGFSIEDIDAIVVTHSHPDHDDDFASLTTLVKEWNEFHERTGEGKLVRHWDLFLNESTHKKFSSWLQASAVKFGRIIPLPSLCWNKDTEHWSMDQARGKNVWLDLSSAYDLQIEVVPAWHDDVIGKTSAVGLKFHLLDPTGERTLGVIGYTGDTGAYGIDIQGERKSPLPPVDQQYADCDVLIAHLGDVRLRELASVMEGMGDSWHQPSDPQDQSDGRPHPLIRLLRDWFEQAKAGVTDEWVVDRVREFLHFAITLDLIPSEALEIPVRTPSQGKHRLQDWLGQYIATCGKGSFGTHDEWTPQQGLDWVVKRLRRRGPTDEKLKKNVEEMEKELIRQYWDQLEGLTQGQSRAYRLLELACICALHSWQYPYHLGIFGVQKLYGAMSRHWERKKANRVFVVGELPEDLTSHRHIIACWLNAMQGQGAQPVRAFTGDLGLHLKLGTGRKRISPEIRCSFCNLNNEIVRSRKNYHPPHEMREVMIKRQHASMIYLCTTKDHYPEGDNLMHHFMTRPERRLV